MDLTRRIFSLAILINIIALPSHAQDQKELECLIRNTPASQCPSTIELLKFMIKTNNDVAKGYVLTLADESKLRRITTAWEKEARAKPVTCDEKPSKACGILNSAESSSDLSMAPLQQLNQTMLHQAQELGSRINGSISTIQTLQPGETIGFNGEVGTTQPQVKDADLAVEKQSWNDNEMTTLGGYSFPNDKGGENAQLAKDISQSVSHYFDSDNSDKDFAQFIGGLFKQFLAAFASGFEGLGAGLKDAIPDFEHPDLIESNMVNARKTLLALSTLDDDEIQKAVDKYVATAKRAGINQAMEELLAALAEKK